MKYLFLKPEFSNLMPNKVSSGEVLKKNTKFQLNIFEMLPARQKNMEHGMCMPE